MTNSYYLANELATRCDGSHTHQALVDGRAKVAGVYTQGLSRAICRGLIKEKMRRAQQLSAVAEVRPSMRYSPDPDANHEDLQEEIRRLTDMKDDAAYDDLTGMPLDRRRVQEARKEEIDYVRRKQVWKKIPRAEAQRQGCKIIKTR